VTERALFDGLDSCMKWTFRHQVSAFRPTILARMAGADNRESVADGDAVVLPTVNPDIDPRPVGLDAAAQKGMLLGYVGRLPTPERWHLVAKFALGDVRRGAQIELRDYLVPLMNDILRHRRTILECVARFYGKPVKLKDLADKILFLIPPVEGEKESNRKARAMRSVTSLSLDIEDHLKSLASRTEELAYSELKMRGVIA